MWSWIRIPTHSELSHISDMTRMESSPIELCTSCLARPHPQVVSHRQCHGDWKHIAITWQLYYSLLYSKFLIRCLWKCRKKHVQLGRFFSASYHIKFCIHTGGGCGHPFLACGDTKQPSQQYVFWHGMASSQLVSLPLDTGLPTDVWRCFLGGL